MKKRRILAVTLALVALMMCGLTSFATTYSKTLGNIYGHVSTFSDYATAGTTNKSGGNAYVSVRVQYETSNGFTYWSSPAENTGNNYTNTSRSITGTVIDVESAHGSSKNSISFNLP